MRISGFIIVRSTRVIELPSLEHFKIYPPPLSRIAPVNVTKLKLLVNISIHKKTRVLAIFEIQIRSRAIDIFAFSDTLYS